MNTFAKSFSSLAASALAVSLFLMVCQAAAHSADQEFSVYPQSVRHEVDLIQAIFIHTNKTFDRTLCKKLKLKQNQNVEIKFLQISFVFYYPLESDVNASHSEPSNPPSILFEYGGIKRREGNLDPLKSIPLDYVRVFDPERKKPRAELSVLVSVIPADNSPKRRFERLGFKYEFDSGWKESRQ